MALKEIVAEYIRLLPNGRIFNIAEVWYWIRGNKDVSYSTSAIRTHIKDHCNHLGSGQWIVREP